ncbi:unnamed protein product [Linum trigynum]|uniref:Uncharacterized protein n=1 Tax=Linum trigynum TaxID=586398 RepID=A0AAV2CBR3_9ROSI
MIWRLRAHQTEETTYGGNGAKSASLLVGVFAGCHFSGLPGIWGGGGTWLATGRGRSGIEGSEIGDGTRRWWRLVLIVRGGRKDGCGRRQREERVRGM